MGAQVAHPASPQAFPPWDGGLVVQLARLFYAFSVVLLASYLSLWSIDGTVMSPGPTPAEAPASRRTHIHPDRRRSRASSNWAATGLAVWQADMLRSYEPGKDNDIHDVVRYDPAANGSAPPDETDDPAVPSDPALQDVDTAQLPSLLPRRTRHASTRSSPRTRSSSSGS
ncbi:hypothetical protein PsYK624_123010 [Phanerochaete sordida]|uniref:Uncharacterized protein n=1 Tax=Phanerochaete sordida TaxID=48140 RepID=A0A9P3GHK4_9APHY|nr:hypothetical protein PsYK624_123010 [Phanerochaete sordida]